ncbi:hypothetical protein [Rhizobium sp. UGM030330-04]|uniref:hypothetical protein n=1 Tax=Rhizobium sp. UGM030330-04 TaxID=1378077 RepID=UPI000D8DC0B4|nr:hypothetical protein [Rhizobium sp. UGM030330-04]PYG61074.1 hypothetical protein N434_00870 [Rhizobium sp. UGM030330-04]
MADFVAVIRKAVDGLANNTPENRAKVYDKARSAVVRQLENMKPRPPEELLRRQIAKLDAAIAEVDSEYAEALPALEEDEEFSSAAEEAAAPYPQHEIDEDRADHAAEPADEEPARAEAEEPEPVHEEPAAEEPRHETPVSTVPEQDEEVHEEQRDERHYEEREPEELYEAPAAPVAPAVADETHGTYFTRAEEEPAYRSADEHDREFETAPPEEDASVPAHWAKPVEEDDWRKLEETQADDVRPADDYADVRAETDERPLVAGYAAQHYQEPAVNFEPEKRETDDRFGHAAAVEHDPVFGAQDDFSEPRQTDDASQKKPAVVEDFSSYFQDTDIAIPAKDAPALPRADNDPFGDQASAKDNKERTPWDDLDELIGYDGASSASRAGADETPAVGAGAATPAYMVKKKPRRNYASLVLALVGAGLLAGGGYALWMNRDALNDMVGGLVQSAQNGGETQTPPANTPGGEAQTSTPPATQQPPANGQQQPVNPANHQTPTHSDDGSVTGTKFTQRLLADGTERDEGPAPGANGQPVTAEGQSVYEQNVAPPPAGEAPANNAATPAGTPPAQQPAAAATGDRMFLYEEVLGQTVPTAIQGSVSWSLQQENDAEGKPSPTVQGQITVPGRGLSALITFKRNTDPSLPASHLIEIVFSVSPGFEGGAIDSVQRIAMKSTEQDRGNALIAVPAKITDDFHMIALNDFPDAMKTNLELLKSRNWIDIPVSYRNGRRALLTLQKGNDGIAAFDKALSEWAAAAPAAGGQ